MKRLPPKPWPRLTDGLPPPDLVSCQLCGGDHGLSVYEECDEDDRPEQRYLVACADCHKRIDAHPRLYLAIQVKPGAMPQLCARCTHRSGFDCRHPDLKANGGSGLAITLGGGALNVIVCSRSGCAAPPRRAVDCAGQTLPEEKERSHAR